jgi:hypothetical protein
MQIISSYCSADRPQCVSVEADGTGVIIRNTDQPARWTHATWDEWDAFIAGVKNGEFDPERLAALTG